MKASSVERLALLIEELGEASHQACKTLRHGYRKFNPEGSYESNRTLLQNELGDVLAAITIMVNAGDLSLERIELARSEKMDRVREFMHHQSAKVFVLERKCVCGVSKRKYAKTGPVPVHDPSCPVVKQAGHG